MDTQTYKLNRKIDEDYFSSFSIVWNLDTNLKEEQMHRWTDGQIYGHIEVHMNGEIERHMNGQVERQTEQIDRKTHEWIEIQTEQIDRKTHEWIDRKTNRVGRQTETQKQICLMSACLISRETIN